MKIKHMLQNINLRQITLNKSLLDTTVVMQLTKLVLAIQQIDLLFQSLGKNPQ